MLLRKKQLIAVILFVVTMLIFIGAYFTIHQKFICGGTPKESLDCFVQYYTAMVQNQGVSFTLSDLEKRSDKMGIDCHQVAHAIGRAAIMRYDTIGEAFKNGSSICMSGFYHGVMQGVFSKYGETSLSSGSIDALCQDFLVSGNETRASTNCTHGMGHGIFDVTHGDLFRSLDICSFLSIPIERENCYGGVFMENLVVDDKNHISKYLKDDDIFYPCTIVREEYKNACYTFQPIHFLHTSNFHDAFLSCSRAEKDEYKTTCYGGIGVETGNSDASLARQNLFFCLKGETFVMQSQCVLGAASAYLLFHQEDHIELYCVNLPKDLRKVCRDVISQQNI